MKPLAILIAGDPVPEAEARAGGFAAMIRSRLGNDFAVPWLDLDIRTALELPAPSELSGAIITGSASSVTERAAWTLRGEAWLREAITEQLPLLGICYGHQMLGQALGGSVQKNPNGREIGTVDLRVLAEDKVVGPVGALRVNSTHVDSVVSLPAGAAVLASTALEPNAAVRFAAKAWGVQFHPEINGDVMTDYVRARSAVMAAEGLDVATCLSRIEHAEASAALLARFVSVVVEQR